MVDENYSEIKMLQDELALITKRLHLREASFRLIEDGLRAKCHSETSRAHASTFAELLWRDVANRRNFILERVKKFVSEAIIVTKRQIEIIQSMLGDSKSTKLKLAELEALQKEIEIELRWTHGQEEELHKLLVSETGETSGAGKEHSKDGNS